MDAACKRFVSSDTYYHSFILGLSIHWVAVIAIKYPVMPGARSAATAAAAASAAGSAVPEASASRHNYAVILLDSENHRGIGFSELDILRRVAGFGCWDSTEPRAIPMR